jgi:3-dehydro-4-phosphotetronate decarboxylase
VSEEARLRESIVATGASLFNRGLADGGGLMTPTGSSLGTLDPARLSKLDPTGRLIDGDKPTKEAFLHTTMYGARPGSGAVVHLHSTHSVAVSCIDGIDHANCLPPITAYYAMRIGRLPLVPYYPPGDEALAEAVGALAGDHHAVLLANHGPVVAGTTLSAAQDAIEELEETAKLFLLLRGERVRSLTPEQVTEIERRFR